MIIQPITPINHYLFPQTAEMASRYGVFKINNYDFQWVSGNGIQSDGVIGAAFVQPQMASSVLSEDFEPLNAITLCSNSKIQKVTRSLRVPLSSDFKNRLKGYTTQGDDVNSSMVATLHFASDMKN